MTLLKFIEKIGNKIPDLGLLFFFALILVLLASCVLSFVDFELYLPQAGAKVAAGQGSQKSGVAGAEGVVGTVGAKGEKVSVMGTVPAGGAGAEASTVPGQGGVGQKVGGVAGGGEGVAAVGGVVGLGVAGTAGENAPPDQRLIIKNFLAPENFLILLGRLSENFISFPPLALTLIISLAIGLAEGSGFLAALLARASCLPAAWCLPSSSWPWPPTSSAMGPMSF